ncbi:hypothetical protein GGR51DRAFT_374396 [Nemania sp. FL0031]|nr:hypothetical protein GGR51DRAFT_374396 [Nemania sp. FL0031]
MMIVAITIGVVVAAAIAIIAIVIIAKAKDGRSKNSSRDSRKDSSNDNINDISNELVTSLQDLCLKKKKAPTTKFNKELTTFRREMVINALADITGMEKYDIDGRIVGFQGMVCVKIFERTKCMMASEEHVSYVAERLMWVKLLRERRKSIRKHPWVFGDLPPVWEDGMPESSIYAEYLSSEI